MSRLTVRPYAEWREILFRRKRTGMSWQRVENGRFVETWVERDGLGLARDIGAVSPE